MKDYIELSNSISWKNKFFVQDVLLHNKDLDLLYRNGKFFNMAIENNCTDISEALLEYFKKNQLGKYDSKSEEYDNLKSRLVEVIEIAIDEVNLSSEMKKVLSPYINFEGSDTDTINDFLDNYQENPDIYLSTEKATIKKSHSMNDLRDHYDKKSNTTHDNSQEKLLSLDPLNELPFVMQDTDYNNKDEIHSAGEIDYHDEL